MTAAVQLPLRPSDLVFPDAAINFSRTLTSLKKSRLSVKNRLTSILEDAKFAQKVSAANRQPLAANERCGSWYIPTNRKAGSVYFKSTDGHQSEWKFSTRRLNLELPAILGKFGGAIVVDSTRRGKSMPDALSKTLPIWCAVLNYFMFPDQPESHQLVVDPSQVSESERAQIEAKLDEWRMDLAILGLYYEKYAATAKKPMRPYFITRETDVLKLDLDPEYAPIICCSVSRKEMGDNDLYVQGAGDDNENWSRGLTADLFWAHRNDLSPEFGDSALEERISKIVSHQRDNPEPSQIHRVDLGAGTEPFYICDVATLKSLPARLEQQDAAWESQPFDLLVTCDMADDIDAETDEPPSFKHLARYTVHLKCTSGKNGSKALRTELSRMVNSMVNMVGVERTRILFACETGKDLAVGAALTASVLFYSQVRDRASIDKNFIRTRLAMITSQFPAASPSRATLQSVNAFLMQENNGIVTR